MIFDSRYFMLFSTFAHYSEITNLISILEIKSKPLSEDTCYAFIFFTDIVI